MLESPAPFSLNFPSPMKYASKERSSHIAPSPEPHTQTKKNPPDNISTLPSNHYCM